VHEGKRLQNPSETGTYPQGSVKGWEKGTTKTKKGILFATGKKKRTQGTAKKTSLRGKGGRQEKAKKQKQSKNGEGKGTQSETKKQGVGVP